MTNPLDETVATDSLSDDHTTVRPLSVAPLALRAVAVSCRVSPTVRPAVDGVTSTVATGPGFTVSVVEPVRPSTVATIRAVPAARAVACPEEEMIATF